MAAIIGGTLAGVTAFGIIAALIYFLRRRRVKQQATDGEKVDLVYTPFVYTPFGAEMNAASFNQTFPVPIGHANLPPSFPPEIQNDPGGVPRLQPNAMMATFPSASDRPIPHTTTAPYFPTASPAPAPAPAQPTPPAPAQAVQSASPPAEQSSPTLWDVAAFNPDRSQHDADVITVPESTAPSISSSTRLTTRDHRMRDTEVYTMASLLKQGIPAADAVRILEAMRSTDGVNNKGMNTGDDSLNVASSWASTSAANDDQRSISQASGTARAGPSGPRPLPTPNTPAPAYDFKTHP